VTSLWIGEYDGTEVSTAPEFAVADAIVSLSSDQLGQRELRLLQVLKLRGSGFPSGRHAYRLSEAGIEVFPRLADPIDARAYPTTPGRVSSGIPALDAMLNDGYWPGAATLIAGPTGSGKTLMGLHFIVGGARRGEPGVIATLQENPTQLQQIAWGSAGRSANPASSCCAAPRSTSTSTNGSMSSWRPSSAPAPGGCSSTAWAISSSRPATRAATASTCTPWSSAAPGRV
jgi:hypothetical protein